MKNRESRPIIFLLILVLISRIPFLFAGYGSEEDAWALPLVAERIAETGQYEVSRFPGHPVQEIIYSTCWQGGYLLFNTLTLLLSTAGIIAFTLTLKNFNIPNYLAGGFALAFTPILYINSTNDMDYAWALGIILIAGFLISSKNYFLAGCMLALAVGCRITSGAMLLPYSIIIYTISPASNKISDTFRFIITTLTGSLLVFTPVFINYGTDFFTYYEHFPIPGFLKNLYKGTIAVWGVTGMLAIVIGSIKFLINRKVPQAAILGEKNITKTVLGISVLTIALYSISFARVPLKSAFMLPAAPFIVLIFILILNKKQFQFFTIAFVFSCFFFGVNLAEANRGSAVSKYAKIISVSGQQVAIDPLNGLVPADYSKRQSRTVFAKKIIEATQQIHDKTIIIAGWWLADILVLQRGHENNFISYKYYIDEPEIKWFHDNGYTILFLEDQGAYNDLRFRKKFTERYATRFAISSGKSF